MAEPIDTTSFFADTRAFLSELAAHNTRDWFAAEKTRYDMQLKRPAERLMTDVARWLADSTGVMPGRKLFRPHRDVRFSEDKTPYHTHLHMLWSLPDGRAWMLGISPTYATAGAGIMTFTTRQTDVFRAEVDGPEGQALVARLKGWRVDPPTLKRVPAPWPPDHPRENLLRRKGLVVWADDLDDALSTDPDATLRDVFTRAQPVMDWLARVV